MSSHVFDIIISLKYLRRKFLHRLIHADTNSILGDCDEAIEMTVLIFSIVGAV